jgi:hypothetical protein
MRGHHGTRHREHNTSHLPKKLRIEILHQEFDFMILIVAQTFQILFSLEFHRLRA